MYNIKDKTERESDMERESGHRRAESTMLLRQSISIDSMFRSMNKVTDIERLDENC